MLFFCKLALPSCALFLASSLLLLPVIYVIIPAPGSLSLRLPFALVLFLSASVSLFVLGLVLALSLSTHMRFSQNGCAQDMSKF